MEELKDLLKWNQKQVTGVFAGFAVIAVALLIFLNLSNQTAKIWDIQWGYWWFLGLGVFFLVSFALNAKDLFHRFLPLLPSMKVSLFILGFLLLFFALFISQNIERQHRVLSDENSWESMGLQMRFDQSGGVCNQGTWTDGKLKCTDVVNNFKGKSLAFLYSILYKVLPPNRDTALATSLPLYIASLILLFFALTKFTSSPWIALATVAFLGSMPIYMLQSQSASTEALYVFLLSFLMFIYALVPPNQVTWTHLLLIIAVLGFLSGTRQETVFCFIPFTLYYQSFLRKNPWHFPVFVLLVLLASWPAINTMAAYRGYDFQGGTHAAHSLDNLWFNIKSNIGIMMSPEYDSNGLLKNPFYTSYTVLWLAGTLWILIRTIATRQFIWGVILFALFHIQSLVILVNVSGTFEIDINQRYVLIALPSFAFTMAYALFDFLKTVPSADNPLRRHAQWIVVAIALGAAVGMTYKHRSDYNANILYKNNKLLTEEHFLNTELKKIPSSAIYLYSRPWQMLCSGLNAFNEQALLGWTDQEFASWKQFSGGHIYLVRGQDGYGSVDRNSRVVGFKTTEPIQRILEEFETERIIANSKDFGYPLSVYKIIKRKGRSIYAQSLSMDIPAPELQDASQISLTLKKSLPDTLSYSLHVNEKMVQSGIWTQNEQSLQIQEPSKSQEPSSIKPGLHAIEMHVITPEDTVILREQIFIHGPQVQLLQNIPIFRHTQSWGSPQIAKTVDGRKLTIDAKSHRFGFGSHAPSSLAFRLNGKYRTFHALIGLDDESACGDGATWIVRGDQKELLRSDRLTAEMSQKIDVNVQGVLILELETLEGENNMCDHANWASAWLE